MSENPKEGAFERWLRRGHAYSNLTAAVFGTVLSLVMFILHPRVWLFGLVVLCGLAVAFYLKRFWKFDDS